MGSGKRTTKYDRITWYRIGQDACLSTSPPVRLSSLVSMCAYSSHLPPACPPVRLSILPADPSVLPAFLPADFSVHMLASLTVSATCDQHLKRQIINRRRKISYLKFVLTAYPKQQYLHMPTTRTSKKRAPIYRGLEREIPGDTFQGQQAITKKKVSVFPCGLFLVR